MNEKLIRKIHIAILLLFSLVVLGLAVYAGMDRQKATGVGYWFFLHYGNPSRKVWDISVDIGIILFILGISIPGLFLNFKSNRLLSFSRFVLLTFAFTTFPNPTFILNLFYKTPGSPLEEILPGVLSESLVIIAGLFSLTALLYFLLKSLSSEKVSAMIPVIGFIGWGVFTALSLLNPSGFGLWFFVSVYIPVVCMHILFEKTWTVLKDNEGNASKHSSLQADIIFFTAELFLFFRCVNKLLEITAAFA